MFKSENVVKANPGMSEKMPIRGQWLLEDSFFKPLNFRCPTAFESLCFSILVMMGHIFICFLQAQCISGSKSYQPWLQQ